MPTYPELSEAERFPLLTPAGRNFLREMRQHAHAPVWNWPNGEQLNAAGLARVQQFAAELQSAEVVSWDLALPIPPWLDQFVAYCLSDVPFYRRRASPGAALRSIPPCSRADLAAQVWDFVPDSQSLDDLIAFSSSGTTGFPVQTPHHPASAACGVPILEHAIRMTGVAFPRGAEQMALTNIAAYRGAYTTAIVMAYLQEAGCIRVNLSPEAWRQPGDCRAYLDRFWAPVMLGDPQAFAALANVGIERPPHVLVSCIMHLSDALASQLEARYGAKVIDLYALTEAGIVAMKTPLGHEVLPHDLYVEILGEHDEPCPFGVIGEITLTGGRNPYLPLLRYRTGDYASLGFNDGRAVLVGLQGREPVCFPIGDRVVHSMEVTRLLRSFPLAQYQLHQDEAGGFRFGYRGAIDEAEVRDALYQLLGKPAQLIVEELPFARQRKVVVYQSLHPGANL